jgi:tRNA (adenine57-N1/adenine58-N1)-methyltransferase
VSGPLSFGEPVLLYDDRDRQYLLHLRPDGVFQTHQGSLQHSDIAGADDGSMLVSSGGARFRALRPRLADFVLKMKRGAQVVYPKDTGAILVYGDIAPGMTVVEAGTGSGALAMALARAVGPTGRVVSVERREDHAAHAKKAIELYFGDVPPQLELRIGDVAGAITDVGPERVVLDVPEPWHAAAVAAEHLAPGGVFVAYLPTVPQLEMLHEALSDTGSFHDVDTFEVLIRNWNVKGRSVRPSHQMVGHTGFITTARRIVPLQPNTDVTSEARGISSEESPEP